MALRFTLWQPKGRTGGARIYINGLPLKGRAWITKTRKGLALTADEHTPEACEALLSEVLDDANIRRGTAESMWSQLLTHQPSTWKAGDKQWNGPRALGVEHFAEAAEMLDVSTIKVPNPITIHVDHREPPSIIDQLRKAPNTTIEVCSLPLGDYVVNDRVFIERKSIPDFEASVINDDKRLFNQTERIKLQPDAIGVVLLEGDWRGAARMLPQQLIGAISFMAADQKMSVLNSTGPVCTAYMVVKLATHFCNGLGYDLGLRSTRPKALLDTRYFVLEGCPGVSPAIARRLIAAFGSIAGVAGASKQQLLAVEGIGPKTAERIVGVLSGTD